MVSQSLKQVFSYNWYEQLLLFCQEKGYRFCGYGDWDDCSKIIILRHDVDYSLERVLPIAELEAKHGVQSTYFVLLRGQFYNVLSDRGLAIIAKLVAMGHHIGLHFDETLYRDSDWIAHILQEAKILKEATGVSINSVSMHRPSNQALTKDWAIPGMQNAYSKVYFNNFKYLSDSRMHWREDVVTAIDSGKYNKLQILVHPFWYREHPLTMRETINEFIDSAAFERILELRDNFRDLDEVIDGNIIRHAQTAVVFNRSCVQTKRLKLRSLRMADAADMYEYARDPQVCKFLSWGPYSDIEQAEHWLSLKLKKTNPDDILLGIEEKKSHKLIGVIRLYNIDDPENSAEISYILNPNYQGLGYMNEACKAVLQLGFEDLDVSIIYACVDENNESSLHVVQRLGMKNIKDLSFDIEIKGKKRHYKKFSIRKSDIEHD